MKTLVGIKMNVNGTIESIELNGEDHLDVLDAISVELDAEWFDVNDSMDGVTIFIKNDGADTDQVNTELTRLTREAGFTGILHGPGIFLSNGDEVGEPTSLTEEQLAHIVIRWAARESYAARWAAFTNA